MGIKSLPTLREKSRYIIFKLHASKPLEFIEVRNAIFDSVIKWLGEKEAAKANVWIIRNLWDKKKQIGWLKCSHKFVDSIKFSLALIHQIADQKVIFQVIRVAGTLKSGKRKLDNLSEKGY